MKRTHGRAKRGVKLFVETTGKRTKKVNTVAGHCNGEILGQTIVEAVQNREYIYRKTAFQGIFVHESKQP